MKRYQGRRIGRVAEVTVNGRLLNPRLDLWNHSPSGLEWGYAGSGSAQLALAILADCLNDNEAALLWHHDYKGAVVSGLPYRGWTLTEEEVREKLASLQIQ